MTIKYFFFVNVQYIYSLFVYVLLSLMKEQLFKRLCYCLRHLFSLSWRRKVFPMRKTMLVSICMILIFYFYLVQKKNPSKSNDQIQRTSVSSIGIFIVVDDEATKQYNQHIASLACYAYRHSYRFILANPKQDSSCAYMSGSIYFQKHCLVAKYLMKNTDIQWLLVIDVDVLVLNLSKKIESYFPQSSNHSSIYLILSERFNGEIAAGNYLVRNHPWSHTFLFQWIRYERSNFYFPFHNSDNGALHSHLLDHMVGNVSLPMYKRCFRLYQMATDPQSYHNYVGCCKCALAGRWEFKHLRILRRGHSFVRDNLGHDMPKRIWSPTDFLLHGQKENVLVYYSKEIDTYECIKPKWKLPLREDAILTDYQKLKEVIRNFDQAAAAAYPQSVGMPEISDCWPNCKENETRRQLFLDKVCKIYS